jgi:aspartyl-tRNA(Asn)/glutamyl-tRNA(Gln) amidotransferase subunit A
MDEFGMGSSTENSAFHITKNPWDTDRVPGGSSGGSAAAVAAGMCVAALGSDTGGSIRQPAHFCGIVGLKPTYGLVSRHGLISYASSLDTIGPMAKTVRDAALVLQTIAGPDAQDSTCSTRTTENYMQSICNVDTLNSSPLTGRRIAMIKETFGEGVDPAVEAAVKSAASHLERLGVDVVEISLPSFDLGLPAYYIIALSEASSNLARYDGVRYGKRSNGAANLKEMYLRSRAFLGDEVRRRILMGTYALSAGYYDAYYKRAQQVRTLVSRQVLDALRTADALLCPVAPTPAYGIGEKSEDPLAMYKGDVMTVNFNLAGVPAISVPCGMVDGLPIGVQLAGRPFGEAELLSLAHIFEQTTSSEWRHHQNLQY